MALKGTLKDFGIADILQLIGQQQKTGSLVLKSKEQEVQIGFKDGSIVKAETTTRRKKELIGNMLVRAELITEHQLDEALETQKRTLKRLGGVLVASKVLTLNQFRAMAQLQATETLYALFQWKSGTYAFDQGEVDFDPEAMNPLRAESVLMEGFRMVDEWPQIRRVISSYDLIFEKLKPLPPMPEGASEKSDDDGFDDAFADEPKAERKGDFRSIGESERKVFNVVTPQRNVRKLIDLSTVGEFETCKALTNLVNLEYLKPIGGMKGAKVGPAPSGTDASAKDRLLSIGGWGLAVVVVLGLLGFLITNVRLHSFGIAPGTSGTVSHFEVQRFIARAQVARIGAALDVYRLEKGELPGELKALVAAGLLLPDDLRYPWQEAYYYRRVDAQQFVLLPPLR